MKTWLDGLGYSGYDLSVASEDASFRRYFRLRRDNESFIVMDAPPQKESCEPYVAVAKDLLDAGLSAPEIFHGDYEQGFLVITDFGDASFLKALNSETADNLYAEAMAAILKMQTGIETAGLPVYDEELLRVEMGLFREWFLEALLEIEMTPNQLGKWQMTMDALVKNALEQPQAFVHRDYHSRNLMKISLGNPGILDFQDAVNGPVTYDLVSLLRDCYVDWPDAAVDRWALDFLEQARKEHLKGIEAAQFMCWFNLMGIQRHLKAIGIFSRLKLRDGKAGFLGDIPRTLNYLKVVAVRETSMAGLSQLINELSLSFRVKALLR